MPQFIGDGVTFNFNANVSDWPTLSCNQANLLALLNSDLQLDAARAVRLQDGGQLSFQRDGQISAQGTLSLRVGDSPTQEVRVLADGKVGIGTPNPTQPLEVNGAVKATDFIKGTTSLVSSQWADVSGGVNFAGGNVGIGASAPGAGLEIQKENTNDLALLVSSSGAGWGSGIQFKNTATGAKTYGIYAGSDGIWHFADVNNRVDRLLVDQTGNVGIGTTTPNAKLEVSGGRTILEQESWQDAPPMQNNWQPYGQGYNLPQYFKDSQGIVHLRGLIQGGTSFGYDNDGLIFTLPPDYRPPNRQLHVVSTHPNAYGRVDVLADGRVICPAGSTSWLCLDSISFRSS